MSLRDEARTQPKELARQGGGGGSGSGTSDREGAANDDDDNASGSGSDSETAASYFSQSEAKQLRKEAADPLGDEFLGPLGLAAVQAAEAAEAGEVEGPAARVAGREAAVMAVRSKLEELEPALEVLGTPRGQSMAPLLNAAFNGYVLCAGET
jgi:hypothetical protein